MPFYDHRFRIYVVADDSFGSDLAAAINRAREIADTRRDMKSPGWVHGVTVREGSSEGRVVFTARPTALVTEGLPWVPPASAAKLKKA